MTAMAAVVAHEGAVPTVRRRIACSVYEAVLLFGVLTVAVGVFLGIEQLSAIALRHEGAFAAHRVLLGIYLFLVLGLYFTFFWARSGQTLAMQTWRIEVSTLDGRRLGVARAVSRYLAAWLWFLPPLALVHQMGLDRLGAPGLLLIWFSYTLGYAALALLQPKRQFLHDVLCGTQLLAARPAA